MCKKRNAKKVISTIMAILFLAIPITSVFRLDSVKAAESEQYSWMNVKINGGGFIPGIIFNETEPNLIYARTDIGGAYRWDEAKQQWIPLNDSVGWDDWNKNGVDALATDPIDPDRVYMATGTYTNSWDTNGQIMRSTDRGETWESTPLPFKVGGNMPGRSMGERLVIDPNKNNIIYFGARGENGLWKSDDYGVTWNKVTSFTALGSYIQNPGAEYGSDPIGIAWITFDKRTGRLGSPTQTIYVGIANTDISVYRSTDGGNTWEAIPGQPTGFLPHHGVLSSTGMLYITYSDGVGPYDGTKGEVYKFNTATGQWTNISPVPSSSSDNYFGYGGLAVDAQNPDTIMVATLNSWWPDANIYRSTDGGATWTSAWSWASYPYRNLRYSIDISNSPWLNFGVDGTPNTDSPSPKLGWMIGDLEIDPFNSDRMLYGTGATLYHTTELTNWDEDKTFTISPMADGIEETAVCTLVSPPSGSSHLLSGLGDIGGFRHEDLTKVQAYGYKSPIFSSTTSIDYAESNPNFVVRVGNVDRTYTTNKACGFSYDGGVTWFETTTEPSGIAGGGQVAVSADGKSVLWSPNPLSEGSNIGVFKTTNNGNSWTVCQGLPSQSLIYSDRVNPNKFYGFKNGVFYVSTDGGSTFTATTATGLPVYASSVVHSQAEKATCTFKAIPGIEGDIWFAGGGKEEGRYGLWHSTDSGATFTRLSNVEEADTIGFGKAKDGEDYMALYITGKVDGVRGIFRSDDGGESWIRINDDNHQYAKINMCITGDPRIYGRVYVGTNGRGIIYGDPVSSTPTPTTSITPTVTPTASPTPTTSPTPTSTPTPTPTTTPTITPTSTPSPTPVENSNIELQMYNGVTSTSSNTINIRYKIINNGTSSIPLSQVKLRYYYTNDADKKQNFWCDWSNVGSENVTGNFISLSPSKTNANIYFETGFTTAAGSLEPGAYVELMIRISREDWSNYDQSNDYSFRADANSYASWSYATAYIDNVLSWGIEP